MADGTTATGPRIYNLFPLIVGGVEAWKAELPRIAGMGFDWVYLNPFHQSGFSGSLYAVKDPYHLDQRFKAGDGSSDETRLADFLAAAREAGLKVMTDLVINHTSKDALLTEMRPDVFRRDAEGRLESPYAVDPVDPSVRTVWGDLAELDYGPAEAREFLIAYWADYIDHMQNLGVAGFRCDAAYKVPADVWRELIGKARAHDAGVVFAAETLGCTFEETRAVAEAGFDYLFNSFAWWDGRAGWALEQYEELRLLAPSIAFPENHDTARVAAEFANDEAALVRHLKLRYALAAMFSAGVLMPIGYEWGWRRALHVVETTPEDREGTGVDISAFIAAVNRLRADLPPLNVEGQQVRLSAPDAPVLALMRLDAGHPAAASYATIVLANSGEEPAPVDASSLLPLAGGGFGRFADMTPDAEPRALEPGTELLLEPGEVRIFAAARAQAMARPRPGAPPLGENRVVIERVTPELDGGRWPVKRVVGESVRVEADIFSDGHDRIAAELLFRAADEPEWRRVPMALVDNDRWAAAFPLERNARYLFTIEAWRDAYASWHHEVTAKCKAGVDVRLETIEGMRILEGAAARKGTDGRTAQRLLAKLQKHDAGSPKQLEALLSEDNAPLVRRAADRVNLSRYDRELPVIADRLAARFSAWYELFPRSMSNDGQRHGTFDDVIGMLPYVRGMGFDVLYFPPIHPIGKTNRKGRNNTLTPGPDDPGSVYAIGGEAGGHDVPHPELGTMEDFRRLVAAAHDHGLEIALDFAIQCSPDHPWIKEHPDWFDWRPDGTLKYAENPPKKYEDIVNVDFYGKGLPDLWYALRDVLLLWAGEGVRIFRVDNPHTKPLPFWQWAIAEVNARYPDAIFLAEAFTRPKMMRALAKTGFQQSYTYFTWRNTKQELIDYSTELAGEMGEYYRPNFFANTPDINPIPLQTSGRAGFLARATLAATLSSAYGIYSGFELCEGRPLPGREEYIDSEKYELKAWDWNRPGNIREHVTALNRIRRENPALSDFRNVLFLSAWNDNVIAYARMTPAGDNCVIVLVNLDPRNRQEADYEIPLWEFGLPDDAALDVEDLLNGGRFSLRGKVQRIALDPADNPVAIWRLSKPSR